MIKNEKLFYLGLGALVIGLVSKYTNSIEGLLAMEGALDFFPKTTLWLALGGLLIILSLLSVFSKEPPQKKSHSGRRIFEKEPLHKVAARLTKLSNGDNPDIPLIVDYAIFQAIEARASDIHFDPKRNSLIFRLRIEGMMKDVCELPHGLKATITNRLKVLSNLIIYRDATPQDGRFGQGEKGRNQAELIRSGLVSMDFRIAFMPTLHGERIVIRILRGAENEMTLGDLGMGEMDTRTMTRLAEKPQGMIILTGPTGSGKSTSIYATLMMIQKMSKGVRSIATLEDPIEMDLDGINQSQVDESRDFTFAKGLKAIVRQDPDVVMVGEIRDAETAHTAIQAGMTGHLIITTVHAGSSAAAFTRLLEMGVAPYALNSTVTAVIAQRLVRQLCPHCKRERPVMVEDLEQLSLSSVPPGFTIFTSLGCDKCEQKGYIGRIAIFEILEVTEGIRNVIAESASIDKIVAVAKESGLQTLREAGIEAIKNGVTTPEEILRVIAE